MLGFRLLRHGEHLRRGDLVEVLPAAAVLATLDETGCLDGVPFMPEMLPFLGRRLRVEARVERACDTVCGSGTRRMPNTMLLDDLRCDGSGHGGCQAGCRLYWKEAWLRRVPKQAPVTAPAADTARPELERLVRANVTARPEGEQAAEVFRCQATEFLKATLPVSWRDARSLFREFTCGNVGLRRLIRVGRRALIAEVQSKLGRLSNFPFEHRGGATVSRGSLGLRPGVRVRVCSEADIAATLDESGKNRGLWFDKEMVPFCGQIYKMKGRVERFIDERSGEMVELASDCVILEGVVCSGDLSFRRWFCPRAIYPWWREAWLERADEVERSPRPLPTDSGSAS